MSNYIDNTINGKCSMCATCCTSILPLSSEEINMIKKYISNYAKYLGLDADKIVDEFNEYVFETTSKIPVKDIEKEIEENTKGNEEKVFSPYTRHEKKPNNVLYVLVYVYVL